MKRCLFCEFEAEDAAIKLHALLKRCESLDDCGHNDAVSAANDKLVEAVRSLSEPGPCRKHI